MNILIIGATGAIAEACARRWAAAGARLYLVARNAEKLSLVAGDLAARGAVVKQAPFDAAAPERHAAVIDAAFAELTRIDVVLIAHGDLPDQHACEASIECMRAAIETNGLSVLALLTVLANRLQQQRSGVIAVLGSVAGDRGRKSNYVYGSAKALVATFAEGLAGRLLPSGVAVISIKPGFVDTPMTARFRKGLLWAKPDTIARMIERRVAAAAPGSFYAPGFWWLIMAAIKPARVLYRLNI
jgi:short-subunit dehydrogenase